MPKVCGCVGLERWMGCEVLRYCIGFTMLKVNYHHYHDRELTLDQVKT